MDNNEPEIITSEWLKQNTKIGGLLAFFIFSIIVGSIASTIKPILSFNLEEYSGYYALGFADISVGFIAMCIAFYTAFAFIRRKPNAVFWGLAYVCNSIIDRHHTSQFIGQSTRGCEGGIF